MPSLQFVQAHHFVTIWLVKRAQYPTARQAVKRPRGRGTCVLLPSVCGRVVVRDHLDAGLKCPSVLVATPTPTRLRRRAACPAGSTVPQCGVASRCHLGPLWLYTRLRHDGTACAVGQHMRVVSHGTPACVTDAGGCQWLRGAVLTVMSLALLCCGGCAPALAICLVPAQPHAHDAVCVADCVR